MNLDLSPASKKSGTSREESKLTTRKTRELTISRLLKSLSSWKAW